MKLKRPNGKTLPLAAAIGLAKKQSGKKKPLSDITRDIKFTNKADLTK